MCQPIIDDGSWKSTAVKDLDIGDRVTLLGRELEVAQCVPCQNKGGDFWVLEAYGVRRDVLSFTLDKNTKIMTRRESQ